MWMEKEFDSLEEFYRHADLSFGPITNPQWRQFRLALGNGRFFKVPDQIRSPEGLKKWIAMKKPLDVYYSTACWLAPQRVGRAGEKISENAFLFCDLAFDIDFSPFSIHNIEKAKKETAKMLEFLKGKKIKVKYIAFSGSKGFHILCEDPWAIEIENPIEREKDAKKRRKGLAEEIKKRGIKFDSKITVDTRRIIRVPGTINSKTGLECRVVTEEELSMPASEIIKRCRHAKVTAPRTRKGDDRQISFVRKILGLHRLGARSSPQFYYATFLSNRAIGTRLFCPIIEFKLQKKAKVKALLEKTMQTYGLRDAFLFRGRKWFALIPSALQERRIGKILKFAGSANLNSFMKYHETFTMVSPKTSPEMDGFETAPEFIEKVSIQCPEKTVSAGHVKFLADCGIETPGYAKACGRPEYRLSHSVIEG